MLVKSENDLRKRSEVGGTHSLSWKVSDGTGSKAAAAGSGRCHHSGPSFDENHTLALAPSEFPPPSHVEVTLGGTSSPNL